MRLRLRCNEKERAMRDIGIALVVLDARLNAGFGAGPGSETHWLKLTSIVSPQSGKVLYRWSEPSRERDPAASSGGSVLCEELPGLPVPGYLPDQPPERGHSAQGQVTVALRWRSTDIGL